MRLQGSLQKEGDLWSIQTKNTSRPLPKTLAHTTAPRCLGRLLATPLGSQIRILALDTYRLASVLQSLDPPKSQAQLIQIVAIRVHRVADARHLLGRAHLAALSPA